MVSAICVKKKVDMKKAQIAGGKKLQRKIKQEIELYHQKADASRLQIQDATENAKTCTDLQLLQWIIKRICHCHWPGMSHEYLDANFGFKISACMTQYKTRQL